MAISGTDLAITPARAGLARAGATRSGWPILIGVRVPLYALAGVARAGATRSNYTSPRPFVSINGVEYATLHGAGRIKNETLTIIDNPEQTPSRCTFDTMGFVPPDGAEVIVRLGSKNNLRRDFAGRIVRPRQSFVDTPAAYEHAVNAIDYTWGLNATKVLGYYTGSATTIAQALMATYAPAGYSAAGIEANLPTVDGGITFTFEDLTDCLTRLATRIGGAWKCDYSQVVRLGYDIETETPPTLINAVHATLDKFSSDRDYSQAVTRAIVEGGGSNTLEAVAIGETIVPVVDALWYLAAGGVVVSGTNRITYTARALGGGGSLVGPGAAPVAAPAVALASGSGVDTGPHDYAVIFRTAAGPSVAGPRITITVGPVSAPAAAPGVAAAPTIGTGPNPGSHDFATTNVTSAGETTQSPAVTKATTLTPAPTTAPTLALAVGTGVDDGVHDYAISETTAIGETTLSPISGPVTTGPVSSGFIADPSSAPTAGAPQVGTGPDAGNHVYAATLTNAAGETAPSPLTGIVTTGVTAPPSAPTAALADGFGLDGSVASYDYVMTNVTAAGETTRSSASNTVVTSPTGGSGASAPSAISSTGFTVGTGGSLDTGATYQWKIAFRRTSDGALTGPSVSTGPIGPFGAGQVAWFLMSAQPVPPSGHTLVWYRTDGGGSTFKEVTGGVYDGGYFKDGSADGTLTNSPATYNQTQAREAASLTFPVAVAGVSQRNIYRCEGGDAGTGGPFYFIAAITDPNATSYPLDNLPDSGLGAASPSSNTAAVRVVPLTNLPVGPVGTVNVTVYGTAADGSQLKLIATLANGTTSYNVTTTDAGLGANVPTSNTTASSVNYNRISVTVPAATDPNATGQKLYRRSGGAGPKLVASLSTAAQTYTDSTANASLGAAALTVSTAYLQRITLTLTPPTNPLVTSVNIYGTAAAGAQLKLIANVPVSTTSYIVTTTDAGLGANVPVTNTAAANQVALTGIPIGLSGVVTSREVYRTVANNPGGQLKLAITIPNNTADSATDSGSDASLGANVPTVDTSGLTQPDGSVPSGSTSLIMAGTGGMPAAGWAIIGNGQQVIRYTAITASSLMGIPATGVGAITATVAYNSTVTAAPQLTGVSGITQALKRGDDINLLVTVNDTAAQTAFAALFGGTGIVEDYIQDRRLAYTEAVARGTAHLALRSRVAVAIDFYTHDINSRAGSDVVVNLGTPTNVIGTFKIQTVTISNFQPSINPLYHVQASSERVSLEDLLRLVKGR